MFEALLFITIILFIITSALYIFSLHSDNPGHVRRAACFLMASTAGVVAIGVIRFYLDTRQGLLGGVFTLWGYFYMLTLLLIGMLIYLYFSRWKHHWKTIAVLAVPFITFMLIISVPFMDSERRISVELSHTLLPVHIVITTLGELLFFFSFAGSVFYLVMEWQLKKKGSLKFVYRLPNLESIEHFNRWAVSRAFLLLSFGLLTGIFMAVSVFESPFLGTPKEIILYCSWLVMLGVFYLWYSGRMTPHRNSQMNIAVFLLLMGVVVLSNIYVKSGFHSFR